MITQRYCKKPVEIEAVKITVENIKEVALWCGAQEAEETYLFSIRPEKCLDIPTLYGVMRGRVGDFIVKGEQGKFYPCKPILFQDSYDLC